MNASAGSGQTTAKPRLIDTHLHFFPPEYQKRWLDYESARKEPQFPGQLAWTQAQMIEDMDRSGISVGILSLASTPGVWFDLAAADAGRIARDAKLGTIRSGLLGDATVVANIKRF
jgi:6-methylsalicylate decarboxylase